MRRVNQAITVFYSSTMDEQAEARRASVDRVVRMVERARDVAIRLIYWDENIPGGVAQGSGQDKIDAEVIDAYDIYVGCMGPKFGPGTVREFTKAIEGHINKNRPIEVLFAFDETPINPYAIADNFKKAKTFRRDIQTPAKYGRAILYFAFTSPAEFEEKLGRDLDEAVRRATSRVRGGMPRLR